MGRGGCYRQGVSFGQREAPMVTVEGVIEEGPPNCERRLRWEGACNAWWRDYLMPGERRYFEPPGRLPVMRGFDRQQSDA